MDRRTPLHQLRWSPSPRNLGEDARAHPRWTLGACILASSLSFVEGSVLSVALPAIRASYGAGAQQVQWVVNAYLLPLSALLLLGGALGDHFGRRLLLVVGTSLEVWPVAGLPDETLGHGGKLAVVNRDRTPYDERAALVVHAAAGATLSECAGAATRPRA